MNEYNIVARRGYKHPVGEAPCLHPVGVGEGRGQG
jgi:hypothetical protein